jgi:hypothetical protein
MRTLQASLFLVGWVASACLGAPIKANNITASKTIYDGESVPFSAASTWDTNGSTLAQKTTAPFSKPNHLRANLVNKNWWGAAAYVPNNWNPLNLSTTTTLSMAIKSSAGHDLSISLFDMDKKTSNRVSVRVSGVYKEYKIPVNGFSGVDLSKVQAIVFSVSSASTIKYVVDVDNIKLVENTTPPIPTPTPTPTLPPTSPNPDVNQKAVNMVKYLKGNTNLMVGGGGLGNATDYKIDIFYRYLVGVGSSGWRGWNAPDGYYVTLITKQADEGGAIPLFTYYKLAYEFEVNNYAFLTSDTLHQYLLDIRLMYQKLGAYNKPALFHLEPDFFGYLQQYAVKQGKPAKDLPAKIRYSDLPECTALAENVGGFLECIIKMGRTLAPKTKIGFHASAWGDWYDPTIPSQLIPKAKSVANFLRSVGADNTDFITVETSDRDAGYLEAVRGAKGAYWGPEGFQQHFLWASTITSTLGKPALWWQMPFGVPSDTPGGTDGHYRDNRLQYFMSHTNEVVNAGGFGIAFGAGADKQTMPTTDGGQFKRATDNYRANPTNLQRMSIFKP